MTGATPTAALSHIRVLDLSRVLAGPWATQALGDLGAEIIKVERPGAGDETRGWGPPYLRDDQRRDTADAAYFACANRNKKSVTIDFTHPEGQALVRDLACQADVMIENFKVGGLAQYGLDWPSLHELNPGLVYCSITGFGQTGPYARRAGYDFLVQGLGGLMSLTGRGGEEAGAGPIKVGVAVTDLLTGLYAATAILAALAHRGPRGGGSGQHIDLALLDVQVACLANQAMNYLATGVEPARLGNAHPNIVPYQDFPTADGDMILAVGNDGQFGALCRAMGRPELAADDRFVSNAARVANRAALIPILRGLTTQRTTDEWVALLEQSGVPCGPINGLARVFQDPQVVARGLRIEVDHPLAGTLPLVASPMRLSDTPVAYRSPPPLLGEHTRAVLSGLLHLDNAALDRLAAARVI